MWGVVNMNENKSEEFGQRIEITDRVLKTKTKKLTQWETTFLESCNKYFKKKKELTPRMKHYYVSIIVKYNYGY